MFIRNDLFRSKSALVLSYKDLFRSENDLVRSDNDLIKSENDLEDFELEETDEERVEDVVPDKFEEKPKEEELLPLPVSIVS